MKFLMNLFKPKPTTVDDAIEVFTRTVDDLTSVSAHQRDRANEAAAEIEDLKTKKAGYEKEAARAEKLRQHMEKMLNV